MGDNLLEDSKFSNNFSHGSLTGQVLIRILPSLFVALSEPEARKCPRRPFRYGPISETGASELSRAVNGWQAKRLVSVHPY